MYQTFFGICEVVILKNGFLDTKLESSFLSRKSRKKNFSHTFISFFLLFILFLFILFTLVRRICTRMCCRTHTAFCLVSIFFITKACSVSTTCFFTYAPRYKDTIKFILQKVLIHISHVAATFKSFHFTFTIFHLGFSTLSRLQLPNA